MKRTSLSWRPEMTRTSHLRFRFSRRKAKYLMPRYAFEMPARIRIQRALPGRSKRIALQHPAGRVRCFILVVHHIAQEHPAGDG
jgi:hypothetical protein